MTDTPLVTAILPSWNAAGFIHPTLASLDAQTYGAIEILAGDDASSDETPAILRDWAATRPHVRLILRETNLGWVGNCNALMAEARGEFMFFAFHDDELEPEYIASLVQALQDNPEAVLAYGLMRRIESDGTESIRNGRKTGLQSSAYARARGMITGGGQWGVPNHGLFRASAFARIGGMKRHEAGEFSADFPWILHMMLLGRFILVPKLLCTKRMRGTNLSQAWNWDASSHIGRDRAAIREIRASKLTWWQKWKLSWLIRIQRRGRR